MIWASASLLLLLLAGVEALVPTPVRTAIPEDTVRRVAIETPTAITTALASVEQRGVSIPPVSIAPISIPPVSIPSLSLDLPKNTCTPTIAPDKNGWVPASECNALYLYYPSFGAAIAFSVLFGVVMIAHFIQATFYKAGFVWVVLMGATWECAGFVVRSIGTRDQQSSGIATTAQLFILLSPLWVNAFDYMVLARMIHFYIPSRTIGIFKPAMLAKIFVVLDFGAFIIQLVGGGMAGPGQTPEAAMRGIHIYMGGIGIQEFFILLFLILAVQFHRQMLHLEHTGRLLESKRTWRPLLYSLYISLLFITVRIIYRLIEFSSGHTASNPIPYHEWYMYVFDAAPMLVAIGVWNVTHPGKSIRGPDAKMPSSGISKLFCCACCRSCCRRGKTSGLQKLPDSDPVGDEMLPFRHRPPSPYR
ncbi:hypothetical protein MGYG_00048 [Nannizzia gypsea CBS 118893]|uniref:RTA1 domain-containing protein n=1 Tax=Arthroderma gypseum (strain ATCC MYA-4604 / CBS 118893) TaxID=535722 RepID=E5R2B5_ARTGP|nr:hypothetical protein MGYG_00048 [Nannizzia gypsea CBS 118893]EFQ97005.1 hypothetical protein MGYG_00048 [Nannizzia gypsea CBS 118893]